MSSKMEFYLENKHQKTNFLDVLSQKYGERFIKYRQDWDSAGQDGYMPDAPLHLNIELNNYCNLKCKMCIFAKHYHKSGNERKHMDVNILRDVMYDCKGKIAACLLGTSSEGLIYPEIEKALEIIHGCDIMDFMIATNGVYLTEAISELVVALQLSRVHISLDAATQETYKTIRGGSLDKVERNIRNLIREKEKANSILPYIRLTFVRQRENVHEEEMFIDKWKGLVDRIDVQHLYESDVYNVNCNVPDLGIANSCITPFRMMTIDVLGDAFPCCSNFYKFLKMGNVFQNGIIKTWHSESFADLRDSLVRRKFYSACKKCLTSEIGLG